MSKWLFKTTDEIKRRMIINYLDYIYMKLYKLRKNYNEYWYKKFLMRTKCISSLNEYEYLLMCCAFRTLISDINSVD